MHIYVPTRTIHSLHVSARGAFFEGALFEGAFFEGAYGALSAAKAAQKEAPTERRRVPGDFPETSRSDFPQTHLSDIF